MAGVAPIAKLVRTSLARNTPKRIFLALLLSLLQNDPVSDNELVETLLELPRTHAHSVQLEYALEFAASTLENARTFFRLLPRLLPASQCRYLTSIKNTYDTLFKEHLLCEFVAVILPKLTADVEARVAAVLPPSADVKSVWSRLMFLYRVVAQQHGHLVEHGADGAVLVRGSHHAGFSVTYVKKTLLLIAAHNADREQKNGLAKAPATAEPTYALNCNAKKYAVYLQVKKAAWLAARFRTWAFHEQLLEQFAAYFQLHAQSPAAAIGEFAGVFFTGFVLAAALAERPYVLFNWKNYLVSCLPGALRTFRPLALAGLTEDLGDVLIAAVMLHTVPEITATTVGGARTPYDLRKKFLRSCIYLQIVTLEQFARAFPDDARAMSQAQITHEIEQLSQVDKITHEFNATLAHVNTQFTLFEESKLIDYFVSFPASCCEYLAAQQTHLAALVENFVGSAIRERNNERLARLLLALLNALCTANLVFFCAKRGPWMVLDPVIQYLDQEPFNADADDCGFQDMYASFGMIMCSVISIACFFGVNFADVTVSLSYSVDYINRFFYCLADMLTGAFAGSNDDDRTIVANYDYLVADWVAALFDVNNDGLSDELLKSVNVKQIYKFILIVFQQAIRARAVNVLDAASINNGIDYLLQNFLAPCSVAIVKWMAAQIGPAQPHSDAVIDVLWKIVDNNMGTDNASAAPAPTYTFRMIVNVIAPFVVTALRDVPKSDTGSKLLALLQTTADPEYCVLASAPGSGVGVFEARFPLRAIKAEVALLHKKPADILQLAQAWGRICSCMRSASAADICDALLEELARCAKAPLHAQSEELRLFLDYLVYTLVLGSFTEGAKCPLSVWELHFAADSVPTADYVPASVQFGLSIDHHYLSVFNEGNTPANPANTGLVEDFETKDTLMAFETDDLFSDIHQDLFDDPMQLEPDGPAEAPEPAASGSRRLVSTATAYNCAAAMCSPLALTALHLARVDSIYWTRLAGVAHEKLRHEWAAYARARA